MRKEYITEDGHVWTAEEVCSYIRWKLAEGEAIDNLKEFDESKMWQQCVKQYYN